LRRSWQPVCFSDELPELPLRLRIMGADLVAFRDKRGAAGLLELHYPHRGTSLEFGLIGDEGIRRCITAGCSTLTARSWKLRASPLPRRA
jgi:tert-butyl alcohol monooxygenase / tert-amyl alcohol desaturase